MKLEKTTRARRYEDACAAAHALDIVGDRWALLVVRELMLGPRRFGDVRAALTGISANVLAQRLEELEAAGVVVHRRLPPPAAVAVYELTPWGYEAEPIFQALGRWAARSPRHDPTLPFSAASLFLSFRTMLDPELAGGFSARIGFRIGGEAYFCEIRDGAIEVGRGETGEAEAVLAGDPATIAAAVYGGAPFRALEASGVLRVEGDRRTAERFVRLFPLPEPAGA